MRQASRVSLPPCTAPPLALTVQQTVDCLYAPKLLSTKAAGSCPASLPAAGCPAWPCRSKSISAGRIALALATAKMRRRRWGTPKNWASRTRQAISRVGPSTAPAFVHFFPAGSSGRFSPASPPKKQPKALSLVLSTPGTFSQTRMHGGCPFRARIKSIASNILIKTKVKLPRSSSKLPRNPATEKAWQGVPPTKTSGASTLPLSILPTSCVISPWLGTCGQWWARTADGNGSISANQAGCQPKGSHATDAASMPLHRLP